MAKVISNKVRTVEEVALNKPTIIISRDEMVKMFLGEIDCATFVEVFCTTSPKMNKTGNPYYGMIYKKIEVNGMLGWDYQSNVNKQRAREGKETDFVVNPRQWGTHMVNPENGKTSRVMIEHTNKAGEYNQYIQFRALNVQSIEYCWLNGTALTDAEVLAAKGFMPKKQPSKTQELDKEIPVSDYNVNSVTMFTYNHVLYCLREVVSLPEAQ